MSITWGGGGGQVVNAQIMYFISSPIFLRFSPSDLPVVLMILRKKQSIFILNSYLSYGLVVLNNGNSK
jgi:hypothetical protein